MHNTRTPRSVRATRGGLTLVVLTVALASCATPAAAPTHPGQRSVIALGPTSTIPLPTFGVNPPRATAGATEATMTVALHNSSLPASSTVLGRFAPVYMGTHWSFTQAQATTLARTFSVIAAQATVFANLIGAMKAANPSLRVIAYVNGTFDLSSGGTSYPASWYEHDSKGNRIRSVFGNYLLNPSNSAWASALGKQCSDAISRSHYDGCFIDTLGTAPLDPGYCTAVPIDPATGHAWTATQWIGATSGLARAVQSANPAAVVMANGLANGQKYFASPGSTEPLIAATHVAMVELWLRSNATPANKFKSETEWLQDVNMLVNAQAQGYWIATVSKLWVAATAAQVTQWHKYTLASFLLAANGKAYYGFSPNSSNAGLIYDSPWDHVNVGSPTGAFAKVGSVYVRHFSHGIAVVNPTGSAAAVSLAGTFVNLAGQKVTSETLAPNSGDVFIV